MQFFETLTEREELTYLSENALNSVLFTSKL